MTFLGSGLVHELAITVPARGGYGGPTAFFLLQALGVALERSARGRAWGLGQGPRGRVFMLATLLLPIPLLFPPAFLERVVLPLASGLTSPFTPPEAVMTSLLDAALWLAGIAHFCVLAAGVQVPHRLGWTVELPRLSRFNQRIVWAYHAFIGLTILGFGTLTLVLHDDIMRGDRAALGLVALMAAWWILRLAIDAFWYSHEDWPRGSVFAIGHALLVVAFVGMAGTYVAVLVAWAIASR
jgi:alginate O-acetyltransferase complex protein AlgI